MSLGERVQLCRVLEDALRKFQKHIVTLTFVGSGAPVSKVCCSPGSDFDVLLVWRDSFDGHGVIAAIKSALEENHRGPWEVVDGWGVVSPATVGKPTIHFHTAPLGAYKRHSKLYRRSVAKYPPSLGLALSEFTPLGPRTREELLSDPLGPGMLAAALQTGSIAHYSWVWDGQAWRKERKPIVAGLIDMLCYSVLHSSRNTLRLLGFYSEFSPLSSLSAQWELAGLDLSSTLEDFVAVKRERRLGTDTAEFEVKHLQATALKFLQSIAESLSGVTKVDAARCATRS